MFNNQFKNNCNPIKNEENLKKHLLVLIQRSINVRAELDKIKQYKEELKTRPGKQPPSLQSSYDYHSFKKTFFIEEVSGDCTVRANKTEVVIKESNVEYNIEEIGKEGLREAIQMFEDFFFYEHKGQFIGLSPEEIYETMKNLSHKDNAKENSLEVQFDDTGKIKP